MILGRPKIEVTKVLTHHAGKNGEYIYGENWHDATKNGENSDGNSNLVSKDLMHHAGRNGEHSCVDDFHGDDLYPHNINKHSCTLQSLPEHQSSKMHLYPTKGHIKSNQQWASFMNSATVQMEHPTMGSTPQKLTGVIPKENLQNMDPTTHQVDACSRKLTGEENSTSTTPHVDSCSRKLSGEANSQSSLWLTGKLMKPIKMDTTSLKLIGETMIPAPTI